jgi:transmembrane sensor
MAAMGAVAVFAMIAVALLPRWLHPAGPLLLAGGGELSTLAVPGAAPEERRVLSLSDGSTVAIDRGARLELVENTATSFVAKQPAGRVSYSVTPGGPRRWSIESPLATVEVVGTEFVVDADGEHLRVDVQRGVVVVRGEHVPDRVQRLIAGGSLEVVRPTPRAPEPSAAASAAGPSPVPPAPALTSRPVSAPWKDSASRHAYDDAYAALGPGGVARASERASVDELLSLADVARFSNHPQDAVSPLSRVISAHRSDPRAPLAAFTLGRVELDSLNEPGRAADAFSSAIELGLPRSLLEDAYARLVEARGRAGDRAGARDAAADYARLFPAGARTPSFRRWTGEP